MSERDDKRNVGNKERLLLGLAGGLMTMRGMRHGGIGGLLSAGLGGALVYRSATGRCPVYQRLGIDTTHAAWREGIQFHRAVTIARPIEEIMRQWGDLERFPEIFDHIEAVESLGDGRSRWRAREAGKLLEWTAEVTERSGDRIAFRTTEDSDLHLDGEVRFREAPGDRGTEVRLSMRVSPPPRMGGSAAMVLAPLLRRIGRHRLGREMARFKQLLESGEIATAEMMSPERKQRLEERPPRGEYIEAEIIEPAQERRGPEVPR